MNIYKIIIIIGLTCFMVVSCKDLYMGIEQIKTSNTKPEKLSVQEVIPKSGALEIHFTLPKGNDQISKVDAWYFTSTGEKREFSVSRYSSFILVEGFTGTNEVNVEMKVVDNSGYASDITTVSAAPLK